MSNTIVICGYGPGVSDAVAERFGKEGFNVALASRSTDRLKAAEQSLKVRGVRAVGFPTDLTSAEETKALIANARAELGPITAILWNSFPQGAGDLTNADVSVLQTMFDFSVNNLVVAVQTALPDLRATKGALLVTNGAFALLDPNIEAMVVQWSAMGLALTNAAKHKLTRLFAEKLRADGIYVGEVMIVGTVKGTPGDNGSATVSPKTVADTFWDLYSRRTDFSVTIR